MQYLPISLQSAIDYHNSIASASSWPHIHSPSVYLPCHRCPRQSTLRQRRSLSSSSARNRVFAGHVPGRGADGTVHTRAGRCSHVRVPALIRDFERVENGRGQGRGGRRACGCGYVSVCVRWTCSELLCSCWAFGPWGECEKRRDLGFALFFLSWTHDTAEEKQAMEVTRTG